MGDVPICSDFNQVLNHIFALARQAQAVGFRGPSLGVTYYKTRAEQLELEAVKQQRREEEAAQRAEYNQMLAEKRDVNKYFLQRLS